MKGSHKRKNFFHQIFFKPFALPLLILGLCAASAAHADWWSKLEVEETRELNKDLKYERVLYETVLNEPVRAHILSVTFQESPYIFGILGSYGTLFRSSQFARNSEAIAVINGSFFSRNPTRALGFVAAHGRVLYPPQNSTTLHGTVGFTPDHILFGWLGPDQIQGNRIQSASAPWNQCHALLGAGPLLLLDGKNVLDGANHEFDTSQRAPRTAIAKTRNGTVLMVVVDGRQPSWSAGVTLQELLQLLQARQASDALNLDGGGSSTMVLNNEVVNRPSDGSIQGMPGLERAVANVIALFRVP